MNASCARHHSLIVPAVDGEIHETDRDRLMRHLDACPDCTGAFEFQERLRTAIHEAPLPSPPPVYFEGVLAEIHRRMPQAPPRAFARPRRPLSSRAFATAFMAALVMVWCGALIDTLRPAGMNDPDVVSARPVLVAKAPAPVARPKPVRLVEVKGYGLVPAGSDRLVTLLQMQREGILVSSNIEAPAGRRLQKG